MRLLTIALLLALTSCTYHYHYHAVENVPTYRPLPYICDTIGSERNWHFLPYYNPRGWFENVPCYKSSVWINKADTHRFIGIGIGVRNVDTLTIAK